jgi:tRNA pseudouridine55 synthase
MNGIINILKPTGMTSHDVVAKLRRILSQKKIGHAGTLDPNAAGVLVICVGKATRLSEYLLDFDKEYICNMRLGVLTDTFDIYGNIISRNDSLMSIDADKVTKALDSFVGSYEQLPPMYSALKVKGKKLYEYAREDITVERKKRTVVINSMKLLAYDFPNIRFKVSCSKGTYIRTICYDIAERLNTYGTMISLIRIASKGFSINDAYTIAEIEAMTAMRDYSFLLDYDKAMSLDILELEDQYIKKLLNGMMIELPKNFNCGDLFYIKNSNQTIIGLGEIKDQNKIKIKKLLI